MEKRRTRLSYHLLKNTIYTSETLAKALKCSIDTIYELNKLGMPHVEGSKRPYIYDGVEVKKFLAFLFKPTKLLDSESFCVACKKVSQRLPEDVTITYIRTNANEKHILNIVARCIHCGANTNRYCNKRFAYKLYPGLAVMGFPNIQLGMARNSNVAYLEEITVISNSVNDINKKGEYDERENVPQ